MDELKISPARFADADEILEVQKLAFHSEAEIHQNYTIPPLVQTIKSIQEEFSDYRFYKATMGKNIIASVKVRILENNILQIGRLVVLPDYQNRGIGKKLIRFIENTYEHVKAFELFTAEKSIRNTSFYKNLGYIIKGKYTEPGHSDIILLKFVKNNTTNSN